MASQITMKDVAWARVETTGAAIVSAGDIVTATTGAGVYTLTLGDGGLDANDGHIDITVETANIIAQLVHTSDTVKTVNTFLGSTGAATNARFSARVSRMTVG